jgi:restriction system-associated AAA family ATPase
MKLLRLKITDPTGFRSLPSGFEHVFRSEWRLQNELQSKDGFAPFVCAGRNGSGKSNLLEALAAIFYQLELQRVQRSFLPEALAELNNEPAPCAFELEYLISLPKDLSASSELSPQAHVLIEKTPGKPPQMQWKNAADFAHLAEGLAADGLAGEREREFLLPEYVLGYSSGENELLSLPFFKLRFVQFDEYWNSLLKQLPYSGRPETRMAYFDDGLAQAVLICHLLFAPEGEELPFFKDVGIEALKEFRIILKCSIPISDFDAAMWRDAPIFKSEERNLDLKILHLMEGDDDSPLAISGLKRCATLHHIDEATDTLILDYKVDAETKKAFQANFKDALELFQAFQVLMALNLYTVNDVLKNELYESSSQYVSETVPRLASDQRIMRFKFVRFSKLGVVKPMMMKDLSDGEYQLVHSLGLCALFRNTNSLFLMDEPETHFNPDWRSKFVSLLRQCLPSSGDATQEMLVTTHSPFLISDSKPENVLVFEKHSTTGAISIHHPEYNTLGASINKITMSTFEKSETIGGHAQALLEEFRVRFEAGVDSKDALIDEIHQLLGDSVEKLLLIHAILGKPLPDKTERRS